MFITFLAIVGVFFGGATMGFEAGQAHQEPPASNFWTAIPSEQ